jgi:hypothetical protein
MKSTLDRPFKTLKLALLLLGKKHVDTRGHMYSNILSSTAKKYVIWNKRRCTWDPAFLTRFLFRFALKRLLLADQRHRISTLYFLDCTKPSLKSGFTSTHLILLDSQRTILNLNFLVADLRPGLYIFLFNKFYKYFFETMCSPFWNHAHTLELVLTSLVFCLMLMSCQNKLCCNP